MIQYDEKYADALIVLIYKMADQTKEVECSIQQQLRSLTKCSDNLCIYKVPEHIYNINKECYMPCIVSIGPIYYKNPSLKSSQELKLRHLECFLKYGNQDCSLSQYIDRIKELEEVARSYYEETISLSSNEFIEMMMVDAAFIIYYFLRYDDILNSDSESEHQHLMSKNTSWIGKVDQDLFLEENQLPFFVLNNIYEMAFSALSYISSFKDLVRITFGNMSIPGREAARTEQGMNKVRQESNIKHLVDFLRVLCLPTQLRDKLPENEHYPNPPTVKELKAAGVKIIAADSKSLLDISFSKGVLHIPTLTIQDNTEAIFRNVISFEQCHYFTNSYFIDYVFFLDALIDTSEDVQILVECGVINHLLGSEEQVAIIINQLTRYVLIYDSNFYYTEICESLNEYSMIRWNKWKTILRREYFNHPWSIISVVYLVLLFILTILQVYTGFIK